MTKVCIDGYLLPTNYFHYKLSYQQIILPTGYFTDRIRFFRRYCSKSVQNGRILFYSYLFLFYDPVLLACLIMLVWTTRLRNARILSPTNWLKSLYGGATWLSKSTGTDTCARRIRSSSWSTSRTRWSCCAATCANLSVSCWTVSYCPLVFSYTFFIRNCK